MTPEMIQMLVYLGLTVGGYVVAYLQHKQPSPTPSQPGAPDLGGILQLVLSAILKSQPVNVPVAPSPVVAPGVAPATLDRDKPLLDLIHKLLDQRADVPVVSAVK